MTTKSESKISQEPTAAQLAFIERVNDHIMYGHALLSRRFDPYPKGWKSYLLSRIPASVVVSNYAERVHPGVEWTDTSCGKSGVGAISLASHVWRVSEYEAARRIYEFIRVTGTSDYRNIRPLAEFAAELAA